MTVTINLTIAAWAEGVEQRVGMASGGILQDTFTTPNKTSRGVIVPEATGTGGNKFTNPVFDHADWDNDWTTDTADLVATANYVDQQYIVWGNTSAELTNKGVAVHNFRQSITLTVATWTLSCYVKLPNGGAVSATQCRLFYNTVRTTTYTAVGHGWYRLTVSVTGVASAYSTGIQVEPGDTIYADGCQVELSSYATPLCVGDMLGAPGQVRATIAHPPEQKRY